MEADFQRYYGLDLLDFYRGKLSVRKTAVLALKLPQGAETWRELGGPMAWTPEMFMGAAAVHALRVANWQRTEDSKNKRNYPEQIEPPKYEHERRGKLAHIANQAEAFLARQRIKREKARYPEGVGE